MSARRILSPRAESGSRASPRRTPSPLLLPTPLNRTIFAIIQAKFVNLFQKDFASKNTQTVKCPQEITKITDILFFFGNTRFKIMVGCLSCTYPCFRFLLARRLSRSRSVVECAHIQSFTFLTALTLKITVGCPPCTCPSIRTKTCARVGLLDPDCTKSGWRVEGLEHHESPPNTVQSNAQKSHCVNTF